MESLGSFDARAALERLVARHPALAGSAGISSLLNQGEAIEQGVLLLVLQELLLKPAFTVAVVGCFRPLVPRVLDGLIRSLEHSRTGNTESQDTSTSSSTFQWNLNAHEYAAIALSRTLELAPHVLSAVVKYFSRAPPPFERLLLCDASIGATAGSPTEDIPSLLDVLRASYLLLHLHPSTFRDMWDWSPFLDLLQWKGDERQVTEDVRWCATEVLCIILKMSDLAARDLRISISQMDEDSAFACLLRWEEYCQEISVEKAGMYMKSTLPLKDPESAMLAEESIIKQILVAVNSKDPSVEVCGIELPVRQQVDSFRGGHGRSSFVLTSTARSSLEAVVLALSQRQPVLLEGPVGAGKTSLIRELAQLTGNSDVVFIQLDDQMDSKTLLGTYVCREVPGEFQWQPGALTQAVTKGLWVVFEDIDRAPSEIFSALTSLLEDGKLYIPGRGELIQASENFRLFSTVTSFDAGLTQKVVSKGGQIPYTLWRRVVLDSPTDEELASIVAGRFPKLAPVVSRLIGTFNLMKQMQATSKLQERFIHFGHQLSPRDLMKWSSRLNSFISEAPTISDLSVSMRERVYLEAVDCFVAGIPTPADRELVMETLASHWGVSFDRVIYYSQLHKPKQQDLPFGIQIGRITLQALHSQRKTLSNRVFATTGHAMRKLESIAACVQHQEPMLLVGETGTGKTTLVQYLARQISMPLVVLNMSQQSDSTDFLGGFKPVEAQGICVPLFETFKELFCQTFSSRENSKFLERVYRYAERRKWEQLLEAFHATVSRLGQIVGSSGLISEVRSGASSPRLRGYGDNSAKRKRGLNEKLLAKWRAFSGRLRKADKQVQAAKTAFAFEFVEGALVKALREGHWLLLDEINLAPIETLERLSGVLEWETGTLSLTERGDVEVIARHSNFRIFACMNPATDVGKRDLPVALKNRFTEFFIDEMTLEEDLQAFVFQYLEGALPSPPVADIVDFYLKARSEAEARLLDGAGQKPQYSLRSLSRSLEYTRAALSTYGFQRALYDGLCMSFLTLLDRPSTLIMGQLIAAAVFGNKGSSKGMKSFQKVPPQPTPRHVLFEQFWVETEKINPSQDLAGSETCYVLTKTVREHLKNLARAVSMRYPVLLQGPTSSGKTSLVEHLASVTSHRFVRINNHEHTELQEYLGSYATDASGKLVFQEGILVEAVRHGYWVVLDELNLAPSDVLEALNRLLDDNRELFVPELQSSVRAHPHFLLFATQNPPGIYGGRKVLSRAFRNRFVELHVDDIPDDELQTILEKRCMIPGSYSSKMVDVMKDLQMHRQSSQVFAGKHGFITARDLFRWAERHANGYEELAIDGYMLLAERLRDVSEKTVVHSTLERHMRVKIEIDHIHELSAVDALKRVEGNLRAPEVVATLGKIVWTKSMKRLFNLVERCIRHAEPILLVGETGCGKTTVCQLMALLRQQQLHILNCHQHTETSDFLGGFRPVRDRDAIASKFQALVARVCASTTFCRICKTKVPDSIHESNSTLEVMYGLLAELRADPVPLKLSPLPRAEVVAEIAVIEAATKELLELQKEWQAIFVWRNGPLVEAMRAGDLFLVDEISLAEDSVLERLNSVLEPKRLLVLAEKGGSSVEEIVAHPNFRIMATMNPGGDFGKKELSPALRNRFTEIWVPPIVDMDDLQSIIVDRFANTDLLYLVDPILQFWQWFHVRHESARLLSVRDLLAWTTYINSAAPKIGSTAAFVHGAFLVLLDGLGVGLGLSRSAAEKMRGSCLQHLLSLLPNSERYHATLEEFSEPRPLRENLEVPPGDKMFGLSPFFIPIGGRMIEESRFELTAPTTGRNAFRILRALQLPKPVLLEGSPGVGKTSLVAALAASSGHSLVRINLSEQTDMMDLLGSDLPVQGEGGGQFHWSDGVFLQALKAGDWVLLDELNLASQSVLEGLNACLDHRAEVFVPELGRSFKCPPTFRVFACQNPTQQGGGRKGLPKSFLNRFTKVYVDALTEDDYKFIASALHPCIPQPLLVKMIRFNDRLHEDTMVKHAYGQAGSPWEFNLRDILRWCELIEEMSGGSSALFTIEERAAYFLDVIYLQRMRSTRDRDQVLKLFHDVFGYVASIDQHPRVGVSPEQLHVGFASVKRRHEPQADLDNARRLHLLKGFGNKLEALLHCMHQKWMSILVGPQASGKTSLVRVLAQLTGNTVHEYALSSATDTTELLGSFEQRDVFRHWQGFVSRTRKALEVLSVGCLTAPEDILSSARRPSLVKNLLGTWAAFQRAAGALPSSMNEQATGESILAPESQPVRMLVQTIEQLIRIAEMCRASNLEPSVDPHMVMSDLKEFFASLGGSVTAGQFEWVDGGLLKALENGDWVVLDNANLCNPTVLDRLNPLLEPGGTIMINERGLVRGEALVVRAHPNFRLFLIVDPSHGEVSRAMRNRGVEIFLLPQDYAALEQHVVSCCDVSMDDRQLFVGAGVPGCSLIEAMSVAHAKFKSLIGASHEMAQVSLRELSQWLSLFQELLQRGVTLDKALSSSWEHSYARRMRSTMGRSAAMEIFQAVLADVDLVDPSNWSRIALVLPGGWPHPLSMDRYLMHTSESIVRRDSMLVDTLALQFTSYNLALDWKLARNGDTNLSVWMTDKKQLVPVLPGYILRSFLFPSTNTLRQCTEIVPHLVNSVEVEQMLKHAALWVVRQGTFSDTKLRIQWLKTTSCKLAGYTQILKLIICALEKESDHPLYGELFSAWEEVSHGNGFKEQPFILENLDAQPRDDGVTRVMALGSKVLALRRSLLQWQLEDEIYKAAENHGPGRYPTAAVSSYWYWTHRTDQSRTQIQDEAVVWMYRVLELLRKLEDNVLKCSSVQAWNTGLAVGFANLQEWHEALWKLLQQPKLNYDHYLLSWSLFKSSLHHILQTGNISVKLKEVEEICSIIELVDERLSLRKGGSSEPLLWKHGGHPWVPISRELAETEFKILGVWDHIGDESCTEATYSGHKDHPLIHGKTIRWLFVEGLSIVRWLGLDKLNNRPSAMITQGGLRQESSGDILLESKEIYEMLRNRMEAEMLYVHQQGNHHNIPFVSIPSQGSSVCKCVPSHSLEIRELHQWPSSEQLWVAVVPLLDELSLSLDAALLTKIVPLVVKHRHDIEVGDSVIQHKLTGSSVRNCIDFGLSFSSRSPSDFVPHQHLVWIIDNIVPKNSDSYKVLQTVVHELLFNWHQSIWIRRRPPTGPGKAQPVSGSLQLFVASQTPLVGSLLSQAGAVKDYRAKIFQLRVAFASLWDYTKQDSRPTGTSSFELAGSLFQQIIAAHEASFSANDMETISALLQSFFDHEVENTCQDRDSALQKLVTLLRRSQHAILASLVDPLLLPGLDLLQKASSKSFSKADTAGPLFQLGKLWIIIGALRLHLLLPADGCDPMAKYAFKHAHASNKHSDLEVQLKVKKDSELLVRGGSSGKEIHALSADLRGLEEELAVLGSKIVVRPEPPTFQCLYVEVQRFIEMWGKPERLDSLLNSLQDGVQRSKKDSISWRTEVEAWQEIAGQFIHRLHEEFPLYRDIVQPIQLAVYELKYGYSLAVVGRLQNDVFGASSAEAAGGQLTGLLSRLMQFPSSLDHNPNASSGASGEWNRFGSGSGDIHELVQTDVQKVIAVKCDIQEHQVVVKEGMGVEVHIKVLRVALLRLGREILDSGILTISAYRLLRGIFESLTTLWRKNQQIKEDKVQTMDFVRFTKQSHTVKADHEIEEESFKAMFPNHSWDLGDNEGFVHADEDDERAHAAVNQTTEGEVHELELAWSSLEEPLLNDLVRTHEIIFGSPGRMHESFSAEDNKQLFCLAYDTGVQIMEGFPPAVPCTLDEDLACSSLLRLGLEHKQLVSEEMHDWNFYKDPNRSEIALMLQPLAAFVDRLSQLLEDWPGHPILQQLLQLSRSLLSISLDSPVLKALTGLELLLSKAQQWEEHAAKHVSISGELESVSRLVTRWRKLELQCWPRLLDSTKMDHESKDNKFWFFLHDILNGNVVEDVDTFIQAATKSMEEFIQTCTLGQFSKRLGFVRSFYGQFSFEIASRSAESVQSRDRVHRLSDTLYNIWKYYSQFLPGVTRKLSEEKNMIEKELKDLQRLSKWDDRSHYRLAASAEKTHRKLHKLTKRYDDLLKRPVIQLLTTEAARIGTHNLSVLSETGHKQTSISTKETPSEDIETSPEYIGGPGSSLWNNFHEARINFLTPENCAISTDLASDFRKRLSTVTLKTHDFLASAIFSERGQNCRLEGIRTIYQLGRAIISRSSELRTGGAKRPLKKKALVDLLKTLKQLGLSRHKSAVPKTERNPEEWFQQPASEAGDILCIWRDRLVGIEQQTVYSNPAKSSMLDNMCRVWHQASDYFFNNMALIQQLHQNALDFSKDLTFQEVETSMKYVEHLLYLQRQQRHKIHSFCLQLSELGNFTQLLNDVCSGLIHDKSLPRQRATRKLMWQQKDLLDSLISSLTEIQLFFETSAAMRTCPSDQARSSNLTGVGHDLKKVLSKLKSSKSQLDILLIPDRSKMRQDMVCSWPLLATSRMQEVLRVNYATVREAAASVKDLLNHQVHPMFLRVAGWVSLEKLLNEAQRSSEKFESTVDGNLGARILATEEQSAGAGLVESCEQVILEVKLAVQGIIQTKSAPEGAEKSFNTPTEVDEDQPTESIRSLHVYEAELIQKMSAFRINQIHKSLSSFVSEKVEDGKPDLLPVIGRLLACISGSLGMLEIAGMQVLADYLSLHKTVTKLGYILGNLFNSLYREGFCTTPDEEEGQEGATKFEDAAGTGMGEGEGMKDISDQIEDEEQLLGTAEQNIAPSEKEKTGEKQEKGVEMGQDFQGEMLDLSEDESEEDAENEEDEDKLDSMMGEADGNEQIVDEKLWNDEEDKDAQGQQEGNEKYEKDAPVSAGKDALEMRAKEGDDEDRNESEKLQNSQEELTSNQPTDLGLQDHDDIEGENGGNTMDDAYEDPSGLKPSKEEDFELPENMELDDEDGDADGDQDAGEDLDELNRVADADINDQETVNADEVQKDPEGKQPEQEEGEPYNQDPESMEVESAGGEPVEDEKVEGLDKEGISSSNLETNASHQSNIDQNGTEPQCEPEIPGRDAKTTGGDQAAGMYSGLAGNPMSAGQDKSEQQQTGLDEAVDEDNSEQQVLRELALQTARGDRGTSSGEPLQSSTDHQSAEKLNANPHRTLGDALKQWKDKVRVRSELSESGQMQEPDMQEQRKTEEPGDGEEYQYVTEREETDLQALGGATEEQLQQQHLEDVGQLNETSDGVQPMLDFDEEEQKDQASYMKQARQLHPSSKDKSDIGQPRQHTGLAEDEHQWMDLESLHLDEESLPERKGESVISVNASTADENFQVKHQFLQPSDAFKRQILSDEDMSDVRKEVEERLKDGGENARVLWQRYDQLTARLSQDLAEQLRLILEPTLAAKLEGDYRTGKRINMKKVIPYVASQFKKDKIWLRRTKASKRQYQVVIAIDDSRSMSESHCGHMALEALITTCRAMSQLEIGQMAVTSFGEKGNVRLLHDFDQPFSSEAGTNILSQFSFQQDNTIADEPMVDLLHFLTQMLRNAAMKAVLPSGRNALQQLVLVIADGRFHEKENLKRCVREAMTRNQLLAFVVLDNPRESIFEMQTVSFSSGTPTFTRYMDSFPFPYYTLLRNIEDLPRTLGGLLRQWFELMQRTSS